MDSWRKAGEPGMGGPQCSAKTDLSDRLVRARAEAIRYFVQAHSMSALVTFFTPTERSHAVKKVADITRKFESSNNLDNRYEMR